MLLTDFSAISVSAILEQTHTDGKQHVVAFASRCCNAAESRLASSEGELLALIFGVQKFHHYLAGAKFTCNTDNAALKFLETGKGRNPKLARWAVLLANYDF